jgi:ankyrin repeat protein
LACIAAILRGAPTPSADGRDGGMLFLSLIVLKPPSHASDEITPALRDSGAYAMSPTNAKSRWMGKLKGKLKSETADGKQAEMRMNAVPPTFVNQLQPSPSVPAVLPATAQWTTYASDGAHCKGWGSTSATPSTQSASVNVEAKTERIQPSPQDSSSTLPMRPKKYADAGTQTEPSRTGRGKASRTVGFIAGKSPLKASEMPPPPTMPASTAATSPDEVAAPTAKEAPAPAHIIKSPSTTPTSQQRQPTPVRPSDPDNPLTQEELRAILLRHKEKIRSGDTCTTALTLAAANGNLPLLHDLLTAGVPVIPYAQRRVLAAGKNKADLPTWTIARSTNGTFHIAVHHNSLEAVRMLLGKWWETECVPLATAGQDQATQSDAQAAKMRELLDLPDDDKRTPLNVAAEVGATAIATELLSRGASVDIPDYVGRTPLHQAARCGKVEVVQLLLARGADRKWKDKQGRLAVDRARANKHAAIVKLLQARLEAHELPANEQVFNEVEKDEIAQATKTTVADLDSGSESVESVTTGAGLSPSQPRKGKGPSKRQRKAERKKAASLDAANKAADARWAAATPPHRMIVAPRAADISSRSITHPDRHAATRQAPQMTAPSSSLVPFADPDRYLPPAPAPQRAWPPTRGSTGASPRIGAGTSSSSNDYEPDLYGADTSEFPLRGLKMPDRPGMFGGNVPNHNAYRGVKDAELLRWD